MKNKYLGFKNGYKLVWLINALEEDLECVRGDAALSRSVGL